MSDEWKYEIDVQRKLYRTGNSLRIITTYIANALFSLSKIAVYKHFKALNFN